MAVTDVSLAMVTTSPMGMEGWAALTLTANVGNTTPKTNPNEDKNDTPRSSEGREAKKQKRATAKPKATAVPNECAPAEKQTKEFVALHARTLNMVEKTMQNLKHMDWAAPMLDGINKQKADLDKRLSDMCNMYDSASCMSRRCWCQTTMSQHAPLPIVHVVLGHGWFLQRVLNCCTQPRIIEATP
jgi:ribosomal protein S30